MTSRFFYTLGTWLFGILNGLGHLATQTTSDSGGPEFEKLEAALRAANVTVLGRPFDIIALNHTISVIMGVMLLGYGVVNLLILRKTPQGHLPDLGFHITNVVFVGLVFGLCFGAFLLGYAVVFLLPATLTGLALACYLGTLYARLRPARLATSSSIKAGR